MDQQHRLRFGPAGVDFQQRINYTRMREYRQARAREQLKKAGIPAALVCSAENARYVAGVRYPAHVGPSEYGAMLFVEHPDDTIVWQIGGTYLHLQYHAPWIKKENMRNGYRMWGMAMGKDAMEHRASLFAKEIKRELKARGCENEKFGLDGVTEFLKAAIEKEGIKTVAVGGILLDARVIKNEDEVNCMRMAGAIVDMAWWEFYKALRPGVQAREVAAKTFEAVWKNGAEGVGMVSIRTGPDTAPIYLGSTPTDRIIQYGDLVYSDIYGVQFAGYRTCYYRTFKVGCEPTAKEKEWYKKTRDPLHAVMEAIKPGASTADVAKHFLPPEAFGYKDEEEAMMNLCHGVGLAQYEIPIISRVSSFKFPQILQPGMTIACETWFGEPLVGGCRLENMVVVTETGCENLYTMPDDHIIVPHHSVF